MKETLAEKLLAKVLGWEPPEMAKERPRLQAMASFKYDTYEQFSPGLRFVESLALWLNQFEAARSEDGLRLFNVSPSFLLCRGDGSLGRNRLS